MPETNSTATQKDPIINCHAHIFTGDHVPPYLGKSIIKAPFYRLLNFQWIFAVCAWWFNKGPYKKRFGGSANEKSVEKYKRQMQIERSPVLKILVNIVGWYFTFQAVDFLLHWLFGGSGNIPGWIHNLHSFLNKYYILADPKNIYVRILFILLVIILFKSGRNLLFFIAKNTISILSKLPGKQTKELLSRYMTIGRYTFHKKQGKTLEQLESQYPDGSGFIILPMDMEYMQAGKPKERYNDQMIKLAELKEKKDNHIYPFVFVDPRRIADDANFFKYSYTDGKVVLEKCFIKEYIEEKKFSGFKIYPALGYYPFDPLLLPLWKYAEQEQIPILTHCVRGPMYYRGTKTPDWDEHPVFEQATSTKNVYTALFLPQLKNDEFSANFTHPMNFLCLLKKEFLASVVYKAVQQSDDHKKLKDIFGLSVIEDENGKTIPVVSKGLNDLKINLAHFGGNDEWLRYFEQDRYSYSNELLQNPDWGIDFLYKKGTKERSPGKPEQLWKYCDWYSIICSIMLQHNNVYADISYILHSDAQILPLLKQTLQNQTLRSKVLYGTDFFVVRNHKSDKNMLADMMGGLSEEDFDQVARTNPRSFLNLPDKTADALLSSVL